MVLISPDFLHLFQPTSLNDLEFRRQQAVTSAILEISEGFVTGQFPKDIIEKTATDGSGSIYNQAALHVLGEIDMNESIHGRGFNLDEVLATIRELRG